MSFSSEVKEELNKLTNLANKEAVKYEFLGYLMTNHMTIEKNKMKFSTENEYNINRFSKLLNNLQQTKYEIQIVGKTFSITTQIPELEEIQENFILDLEKIRKQVEKQEVLQKALIRGCFLGSGSISNPKQSYHLEVLFSQKTYADFIQELLQTYQIVVKHVIKNQSNGIYAKDGEEISKFLAFIGANHSVLQFEEIRVYREIRGNVNRKVNCETANLNKIVESALKQIQAIEVLKQKGKLEDLSEGLQEIAQLRILHPEASLIELGNMLKSPIGKSGVNHRLKAIEKMAEEILTKEKKN
ncbi:MAG: DNA-binding protein WhiA [Clostridia bacterium]|jgi:DNA-binding protein WhiA|nr:DNA-binding protein WhiA [Clostridia bacterium]MCI9413071.1 DNA-binding protein WhiA [Clostridia bacterium]